MNDCSFPFDALARQTMDNARCRLLFWSDCTYVARGIWASYCLDYSLGYCLPRINDNPFSTLVYFYFVRWGSAWCTVRCKDIVLPTQCKQTRVFVAHSPLIEPPKAILWDESFHSFVDIVKAIEIAEPNQQTFQKNRFGRRGIGQRNLLHGKRRSVHNLNLRARIFHLLFSSFRRQSEWSNSGARHKACCL